MTIFSLITVGLSWKQINNPAGYALAPMNLDFSLLSLVSQHQHVALPILGLTISRGGGQRIQNKLGCGHPRSPTQLTVTCRAEEYWLL